MVGINGRLDTIQAAVLLEKINIFDDELRRRREIAEFYSESFRGKLITPIKKAHTESAWAQYTIRVENREALCKTLKEDGVPTAIHYPSPLSQQPYYAIRGHISTCQIADKVSKSVVSLPFHPYLEEKNMPAPWWFVQRITRSCKLPRRFIVVALNQHRYYQRR